ncbi:hypothetical protein ACFU7Y_02755 [Kitasatospora sp. NPDC057542]|uniref:hypothetical protein n=1 Tax=Streptomycetaceae TaxID=2062 RepID=UPI001CD01DF7|nr:hypothetical protein [Streptomyces sp. LS1784]
MAAFVFLLLDCVAFALAAGSLRGLRRAVRLWFGPEAFVITGPRWARRAKRAWIAFWLALAVAAAGTVVATVVAAASSS